MAAFMRARLLLLFCLGPATAFSAASWYTEANYSEPAAGDFIAGEDPVARAAAVEALGRYNGAAVVADADTGRVLTIVNQKLALADGYIPCSTIKLVVGLAGLAEGLVEPGEKITFPGGWYMTMVEGLAISNNVYFHRLGERLGFERLSYYARLFGLGERAGWQIPGEQLGVFPDEPHARGVGRMSSFGDGIFVTPLQLTAFAAALANGGQLFYLQRPRSAREAADFRPRLKRRLPIREWLPELESGMGEAVRRGTARRAGWEGELRGKTGTCSLYEGRSRTRLGWFASYGRLPDGRRLAVTVMLRGGALVHGPLAAEVAGQIYSGIDSAESPADLTIASAGACCAGGDE